MSSTRTPSALSRVLQWLDRWTLDAYNPRAFRPADGRRAA